MLPSTLRSFAVSIEFDVDRSTSEHYIRSIDFHTQFSRYMQIGTLAVMFFFNIPCFPWKYYSSCKDVYVVASQQNKVTACNRIAAYFAIEKMRCNDSMDPRQSIWHHFDHAL